MNSIKQICVACTRPARIVRPFEDTSVYEIICACCGSFTMTPLAALKLAGERPHMSPRQLANLYGWIRNNLSVRIDTELLDRLFVLPTPTEQDKCLSLLAYLGARFPNPGEVISIELSDPAFLGCASAVDGAEVLYLLTDYMTKTLGWLTPGLRMLPGVRVVNTKIAPTGRETLRAVQSEHRKQPIGFQPRSSMTSV